MAITLDKVIPFGRSLDEYRRMFSLSDNDLTKRIVGIGDGPASFNAEMNALGHRVTSIDPVYVFNATEIENQFKGVIEQIIDQVKATPGDWVWSYHVSPEALKLARIKVANTFIKDFEVGKIEGRYVVGELPHLDVTTDSYDIALCSHFLFLYSDHFSYEFHLQSILEMLRISTEVQIFPLLTLALSRSEYINPLMAELRKNDMTVSIEKVNYELQRGGNEMMKIVRQPGKSFQG